VDENADLYQILSNAGYTFTHKCRKGKSKGGVGIHISKQYTFVQRPDLTVHCEGEFECLMIEIMTKQKTVI
jgi:hypothetical protein